MALHHLYIGATVPCISNFHYLLAESTCYYRWFKKFKETSLFYWDLEIVIHTALYLLISGIFYFYSRQELAMYIFWTKILTETFILALDFWISSWEIVHLVIKLVFLGCMFSKPGTFPHQRQITQSHTRVLMIVFLLSYPVKLLLNFAKLHSFKYFLIYSLTSI